MSKTKPTIRKRKLFPKTLGETIGHVTKPVMKKHGLPDGLLQAWPHIAGADLASYCVPVACKRSKKQDAATIIIEVLPSYQLVAQHATGVLIEKINLHYGYQVVGRVQLKPSTQAAQPLPTPPDQHQQHMITEFDQLISRIKQR